MAGQDLFGYSPYLTVCGLVQGLRQCPLMNRQRLRES